jgi:hypothetical protein
MRRAAKPLTSLFLGLLLSCSVAAQDEEKDGVFEEAVEIEEAVEEVVEEMMQILPKYVQVINPSETKMTYSIGFTGGLWSPESLMPGASTTYSTDDEDSLQLKLCTIDKDCKHYALIGGRRYMFEWSKDEELWVLLQIPD